jgi:threonine synthase
MLAREEGIFCEPAGAVALAGVLGAVKRGEIDPDATLVCLVTGSGFKETESVNRMVGTEPVPVVDVERFLEMT